VLTLPGRSPMGVRMIIRPPIQAGSPTVPTQRSVNVEASAEGSGEDVAVRLPKLGTPRKRVG
jgi:hypothetical protein